MTQIIRIKNYWYKPVSAVPIYVFDYFFTRLFSKDQALVPFDPSAIARQATVFCMKPRHKIIILEVP